MNGGDSPSLRPLVVARGDAYALINIDLGNFNDLQRLGIAGLVWDQVRVLMERDGKYRARDPHSVGSNGIGTTDDIDKVVAELLSLSPSTVNIIRPRLLKSPDVVARLINNEYTSLKRAREDLGMKVELSFFEGGRKSEASKSRSYYGQSDKFDLAIAPLRSYMNVWRKKKFRYAHVNPKEATKRIKKIDQAMADLAAAREELVLRSHVATYRAPSERKKGERVS